MLTLMRTPHRLYRKASFFVRNGAFSLLRNKSYILPSTSEFEVDAVRTSVFDKMKDKAYKTIIKLRDVAREFRDNCLRGINAKEHF